MMKGFINRASVMRKAGGIAEPLDTWPRHDEEVDFLRRLIIDLKIFFNGNVPEQCITERLPKATEMLDKISECHERIERKS